MRSKMIIAILGLLFTFGVPLHARRDAKGSPRALARSASGLAKGYSQLQVGRYKHALRSFKGAAKADPKNAEAWQGLADAYALLGEDGDAKEALQDGQKATGGAVGTTVSKGVKGEGQASVGYYNAKANVAKRVADAYKRLSRGDAQAAEKLFKAALKTDPGFGYAKAGLTAAAQMVKEGDLGGDDKGASDDMDGDDSDDDDAKVKGK